MKLTKEHIESLGVTSSSLIVAVQEVRRLITSPTNETDVITDKGFKLVETLTGHPVDVEDVVRGVHTGQLNLFQLMFAQAAVEFAIKHQGLTVEAADIVVAAKQRAIGVLTSAQFQFLVPSVESPKPEVGVAVVSDGKGGTRIKNGGRKILVQNLYQKHVIDAVPPMPNKEFVELLVKELGMSKAGATTYAYEAKKAHAV